VLAGLGARKRLPVVDAALHPNVPPFFQAEKPRRLFDLVAGWHGCRPFARGTTVAPESDDRVSKLTDFQAYYNAARSHASLEGHTPLTFAGGRTVTPADLNNVRWVSHCRDLAQLPVAA
jgi:hypothetical protein